MNDLFFDSPRRCRKDYDFETAEDSIRRRLKHYFYFPNEYLEYFIISMKEPTVEGYVELRKNLFDMFSIGHFDLPNRIFDTKSGGTFPMKWIPWKYQFVLDQCLWFFVRTNLISQICLISMKKCGGWKKVSRELESDTLFRLGKELLSLGFENMLLFESGEQTLLPLNPKLVSDRKVLKMFEKVEWRKSSGLSKEFWSNVIMLRKSNDLNPTREYSKLAEALKIPTEIPLNAERSLITSAILTACWCYQHFRRTDGSIASIWQLCPLLSLARRAKLPTDKTIASTHTKVARFVPIFDSSKLDFIFDAKAEVFDVVGSHSNISMKMEPLQLVLSYAMPVVESKRNVHKETMKLYNENDRVREFIDSCFVCSAIGLYGSWEPLENLTDIRRIVDFYDWFVRSRKLRRKCVETMGKDVLVCIVREHILFVLNRNPTLQLVECFEGSRVEKLRQLNAFKNSNAENCAKFRLHATQSDRWTGGLKLSVPRTPPSQNLLEVVRDLANSTALHRMVVSELFGYPSYEYESIYDKIDEPLIYERVGNQKTLSSSLIISCGGSLGTIAIVDSLVSEIAPNKEKIARQLVQLNVRDLFILSLVVCKLLSNGRIHFYSMSPDLALFQKLLEHFYGWDHYDKLYYGTCCPYPTVFNMCGDDHNDSENEYGLRNVYIGRGEKLYCQAYVKKRDKSHERLLTDKKIMVHLRTDIEDEMRKIFFYLCDRRYTYQLYRYLITGVSNPPTWTLDNSTPFPVGEERRYERSEVLLMNWRWTTENEITPKTERQSLLRDYKIVIRIPPLFHELFSKVGTAHKVRFRDMVHCKDFNVKSKTYVEAMRKLHEERGAQLLRMECGDELFSTGLWPGSQPHSRNVPDPRTMFPEVIHFPVTHSEHEARKWIMKILKTQKNPITYIKKREKQIIKRWSDDNTCHKTSMVGKLSIVKVKKTQSKNSMGLSQHVTLRLCDHCGYLVRQDRTARTQRMYFCCKKCVK